MLKKTNYFKLFSLSLLAMLTISNTYGLVVINNNSRDIDVEIMDCVGAKQFDYPSTWTKSQVSWVYNSSTGRLDPVYSRVHDWYLHRDEVDFVHVRRYVEPGNAVVVDPTTAKYQDMPDKICMKASGYTGSLKLTNIRNTCEVTIKNKGFMRGIEAEYNYCY